MRKFVLYKHIKSNCIIKGLEFEFIQLSSCILKKLHPFFFYIPPTMQFIYFFLYIHLSKNYTKNKTDKTFKFIKFSCRNGKIVKLRAELEFGFAVCAIFMIEK